VPHLASGIDLDDKEPATWLLPQNVDPKYRDIRKGLMGVLGERDSLAIVLQRERASGMGRAYR
jgi:hypothetical protein